MKSLQVALSSDIPTEEKVKYSDLHVIPHKTDIEPDERYQEGHAGGTAGTRPVRYFVGSLYDGQPGTRDSDLYATAEEAWKTPQRFDEFHVANQELLGRLL